MLFTDIEGSTRLLQRLGPAYADLLGQHHRILRAAIAGHHGSEVSTEGDAFFATFPGAIGAVGAAVEAQRALDAASWPEGVTVAVRMGLHTGEVGLREGELVGLDVHRAARIAAAAHGGQVLLSRAARDLVASGLPEGVTLRDLGSHRLKDLDEPERLCQLDIEGLRSGFPPLRTPSARFHVLPPELSTFVGREAEVARVGDLLARTRLLTLTGPGGTGKTRLALQVARSCGERYPAGVAFVPLAALTDHALVAATIRGALGFSEEAGRGSTATLIDRLREQELLLVLDNFERLLPAAAVVADLLAGTERVSVMVTSRAPLHLAGEQEFSVPPLSVPDASGTDPAALARSEAVALFVERARQVRPDFALDAANAATIARICALLDGLPLAIELAASRVRLLTPDALLARLGHRLDLLQGSGLDREDRQRTLRGAIDWSHDLLGEPVRAVFRRLGAFSGGATLEVVEGLVPAIGPLGVDVLDALATLVDHSLLRQEERIGQPRFVLLETIREYALEQLAAAGETALMAEAHARWFLDLVIELGPRLTSGPEVLDRVEVEQDNVRAALRWAIEHGQTEPALRATGAIWRFWHLRGHLREGRRLAEEVLALPDVEAFPAALSRGRYALASVLYWQNEPEGARHGYEASLAAARRATDRSAEAEALHALGYVHSISREWDEARDCFRQSTRLYDGLGDRLGATNARFGEAFMDSLEGRLDDAIAKTRAVVPVYEELGDDFGFFNATENLGRMLARVGEREEGRRMILRGLDGALRLGDGTLISMILGDLASIAIDEGDLPGALRLVGAARGEIEVTGGNAPPQLVSIEDAAGVAREQGMPEAEIGRLLAEGRALGREGAAALARASEEPVTET